MTGILCALPILPLLLTVAVTDLGYRRIPNLLLLAMAGLLLAAALSGHAACLPVAGVGDAVAGSLIALALTLPGWLLGKLGAGDAKFAVLLGLAYGFEGVLWSVVLAVPWALLFLLLAPATHRRGPLPLPVGACLAGGAAILVLLP